MNRQPFNFWNLWRHGVTQGLLQTFLTCPAKLRWAFGEGYRPVQRSEVFTLGSMVHEALADFYKKPEDFPVEAFKRTEKRLACDPQTTPESFLQLRIAEVLLEEYLKNWTNDRNRNWLALEDVFSVPFYYPDGKVVFLRGRVDGAYQVDGKVWLLETKTRSRIEAGTILDTLTFDFQIWFYLYCLQRWFDLPPGGVQYNVVRKPLLRQTRTETEDAFLERIRADINTRSSFYFQRFNMTYVPEEAERWREEFEKIMWLLRLCYENPSFAEIRNPTACSGRWGTCVYLPICARDDRSPYMLREDVFPELVDDEPEEEGD